MLPLIHYSHVNFFSAAGVALKGAGHEVYVLSVPQYKEVIVKAGLNPLISENVKDASPADASGATVAKGQDVSFVTIVRTALTSFSEMCKDIQRDSELMAKVESLNFDMALVDGLPVFSCIYVVPYRFGLKYITLSAMHDPWTMGVPSIPAMEPHQMTSYTTPMSFLQRMTNILPYLGLYLSPISYLYSTEHMSEFIVGKEHTTISALVRKSEMFLVLLDDTCFDHFRVSAPNYKFVGGASAKKAEPLPSEISTFVDGAEHGIIVVSFGSVKAWQSVWATIKSKFMGAFGRMKQRVLVQYPNPNDKEGIPKNVKLLSWIPQNDLLGHSKARLFVTHGGNNGQLESVFHGVPMLTIPFTGDQFYNGNRATTRGYGKMLYRQTATTDDLYETMQELIYNTTYTDNVRKCSAIMRSMPSPQDNVLFWVEHVLRFGGDHLRPPSLDMPLYSFFMFDVFFCLLFFAVMFSLVLFCGCRCICKMCSGKTQKKKSD